MLKINTKLYYFLIILTIFNVIYNFINRFQFLPQFSEYNLLIESIVSSIGQLVLLFSMFFSRSKIFNKVVMISFFIVLAASYNQFYSSIVFTFDSLQYMFENLTQFDLYRFFEYFNFSSLLGIVRLGISFLYLFIFLNSNISKRFYIALISCLILLTMFESMYGIINYELYSSMLYLSSVLYRYGFLIMTGLYLYQTSNEITM